jgi:hypothetical protein
LTAVVWKRAREAGVALVFETQLVAVIAFLEAAEIGACSGENEDEDHREESAHVSTSPSSPT